MELTKNQVSMTKGAAILFMLLLHLFCTKNYIGLFQPTVMIGATPLIYYFALFGDCCVAMYCFCSGYGLMSSYDKDTVGYKKNNLMRIFKLYLNFWMILIVFAPKYPILIFTWLIILCLISSYVINFFYHPLLRTLDHFTKKRIGFENKSYKLKSVE